MPDGADKLPDSFYDWLDECPVQWVRDKVDSEGVKYYFSTPYED